MGAQTTRRSARTALLGVLVGTLLSGCVIRVRAPLEPAEVVVNEAPPPERVEVVTVAPSPNHIWVRGYWSWSGRGWVWVPGRWEHRRAGHEWTPGHWQRRAHGWVWVPGHWRRH